MTTLHYQRCDTTYESSEVENEHECPDCGTQLRVLLTPSKSIFPSRGGVAESLAEERAEADCEKERDVYRALLHLLACNLLTNTDVAQFIYFGTVTENLEYALDQAYENAEPTDDEDILVCPNCDGTIKSWAQWFDPDHENTINQNRSI